MTAPTNRLLAFFVAEDDIDLVRAGQLKPLRRYFMVQTLRQAERTEVSAPMFQSVRKVLRDQFDEMLKLARPGIEKQMDKATSELGPGLGVPDLKMRVGEVRPQEFFLDQADRIGFTILTVFQAEAGGKSTQVPMVIGMTTLVLKNKVVYFAAYSGYEGEADQSWVREQSLNWVKQATAEAVRH